MWAKTNWNKKVKIIITIIFVIINIVALVGDNEPTQDKKQAEVNKTKETGAKEELSIPEYEILSKIEQVSTKFTDDEASYNGQILFKDKEEVIEIPPEKMKKIAQSIAEKEGLGAGSFYLTEDAYKVNATIIQTEERRESWKEMDREAKKSGIDFSFSEISEGVEKFLPKEETQRLFNEGYIGNFKDGKFDIDEDTDYYKKHSADTALEEEKTQPEPTEETAEAEKGEAQQEVKPEKKPEEEELEQNVLMFLEENFSSVGNVELDNKEKAFYITATDPSFVAEMVGAMEGDDTMVANWNLLVESQKTLSEGIAKTLPGYSLSIKNPVDETRTILKTIDGQVIYNFLD